MNPEYSHGCDAGTSRTGTRSEDAAKGRRSIHCQAEELLPRGSTLGFGGNGLFLLPARLAVLGHSMCEYRPLNPIRP